MSYSDFINVYRKKDKTFKELWGFHNGIFGFVLFIAIIIAIILELLGFKIS